MTTMEALSNYRRRRKTPEGHNLRAQLWLQGIGGGATNKREIAFCKQFALLATMKKGERDHSCSSSFGSGS